MIIMVRAELSLTYDLIDSDEPPKAANARIPKQERVLSDMAIIWADM